MAHCFLRTSLLKSLRLQLTKSALRQVAAISRVNVLVSPRATDLISKSNRCFSTTNRLLRSSGLVDKSLADQLNFEIKTENESHPQDSTEPDFIKEFKKKTNFKIEEKPGHDEVALTRTFGNEKLRLLFSVSEVGSSDSGAYTSDEDEFESEEDNNVDVPEDDEDIGEGTFPIRCVLTVEKQNQGALAFELTCEDGVFIIDNVSYYADEKLANDLTVEGDWQRKRSYLGPRFENLDNEIQILFERYLEERGIDASLALFIPNYVDYKEQKEYLGWLDSVKKFIEA